MKIDKDDLYIYGFISGLIICSPLISVYYGTKWIYNHTPQKVKEKKERDLKIHELEEKLGHSCISPWQYNHVIQRS